jgi:hypothetical protein
MTAGIALPVDLDLLTDALESAPHLLRKSHAEVLADRRFAEAIYRTSIADGVIERAVYQDPPDSAAA